MGLIAAGALVYFSNAHIGADKTQGAIGKRDVYRDSQVASADVATPGSAPVATEAILQDSEFKALAKNPEFQRLVTDANFAEVAHNGLFSFLTDVDFKGLSSDPDFIDFIKSNTLHNNIRPGITREELISTMRTRPEFERLARDTRFKALSNHAAFLNALTDKALANLLIEGKLQPVMRLQEFSKMASSSAFALAVSNGSVARLALGLETRHGLVDRLQDKGEKLGLVDRLQDKGEKLGLTDRLQDKQLGLADKLREDKLGLENKLREDKQGLVQRPQ
jgi:hypothetical protein